MALKILYAIQGTGNGHIARALEVYPELINHAQVDVLLSGTQSELQFPFPLKYKVAGAGFVFGKRGGIEYWQTLRQLKIWTSIKDIFKLPVKDYDLVISDFEPISAWAARLKKIPCINLSHQASFVSSQCPRPAKGLNKIVEFIFKNYAPAQRYIGLHYEKYDTDIYEPIIRKEIRKLRDLKRIGNKILVYLPAYHHSIIIQKFRNLDLNQFVIFSKKANIKMEVNGVLIYPINEIDWLNQLQSAKSVIIGGGFQATSELLYLGIKFMVIPMKHQYEQHCNASALSNYGIKIVPRLDSNFSKEFLDWENNYIPVQKDYPQNVSIVVDQIIGLIKVNKN